MVIITDNAKYNGFGVSCKGRCDGLSTATIVANEPYKIYLDDV